jgi:hypothetical protein
LSLERTDFFQAQGFMSELTVVFIPLEVCIMFFGLVREDNAQNKRLSEMLMQLKAANRKKGNSSATSQLLQEIDDAIAQMSSPALDKALRASDWSRREIADLLSLLQSSKEEEEISCLSLRWFSALNSPTMVLPLAWFA